MQLDLNVIYLEETGFMVENSNYFTWRKKDDELYIWLKKNIKKRLNLISAGE